MSGRTLLLGAAGFLALAGCTGQEESAEPATTTSTAAIGTVAAVVAGSDGHRELAVALTDSQLSPVLDGKGEYTLLAPSDAAVDALGSRTERLPDAERIPLMIGVLRGHILPGQLTLPAIEQAIARKAGPVEMRTMAGDTVRFARSQQGLTVSRGSITARLSGAPTVASNGAVLPIDAVLMPLK